MNLDLSLLSGEYFHLDLPPEKKYLLRYFKTDTQQAFLRYYLVFRSVDNFTDHTGIPCTDRWARMMRDKLVRLEAAHKQAKTAFDLKVLAVIEEGRYKV